MQNDRRCRNCGEPLVRRAGEAARDWSTRRSCNRSCHVAGKNAKPIWQTFAELTQLTPSGCIEWAGHRDVKGYGRYAANGEILAHRLAYRMHFGGSLEGKMVLHRCDNRACVNPQHLFLGDQQANMADMVRKGRSVQRFGTDNPNWRHGRNVLERENG